MWNMPVGGGGNLLQYKKLGDLINGYSPRKSMYLRISVSYFFGERKAVIPNLTTFPPKEWKSRPHGPSRTKEKDRKVSPCCL